MYYYTLDTIKGKAYLKSKKAIRNREQAQSIIGEQVQWITATSALNHYFNRIFNAQWTYKVKKGWKEK